MGEQSFADLDRAVPLALLPVRVEARYLPRRQPTHLCVRIFPDVIHADGHQLALSTREADAGRAYWRAIWGSADEVVVSQARAWLAAQSSPHRSLWIATAMTPTNVEQQDGAEPVFPEPTIDDEPHPVRAALLPSEWMIRVYDADLTLVHTAFTAPVRPDLAMAPNLSAAGADAVHPTTLEPLPAPLAFLAGQDVLWTVDLDLAVDAGMAVRIPIGDVPDPVGALIVLGARAGHDHVEEAAAFADLLESHWYTRGLDVVAQGIATNNSDAGRSGISIDSPDVDDLFERELSERQIAPLGRAVLLQVDPALMYRLPAADVLSLAIGRLQRNPLDRVAHADWGEGAASWAMNVALGYATMAVYLNGPFAAANGTTVTGELTATLRDWYVDWVRGGSVVPVLRCGEQPYGVLPITHRPEQHWVPADFVERVEHHVDALRGVWEDALPVAALDPDATDSTPGGSEVADADTIATVLGAVPHVTELRVRKATDHLAADVEAFYDAMERLEQQVNGDNLFYHHVHQDGESVIYTVWYRDRKRLVFGLPDEDPPVEPSGLVTQQVNLDLFVQEVSQVADTADYRTTAPIILEIIEEDVRPLLEVYREAIDAVPDPLVMWATRGGLGRGDMVNLTAITYDAGAEPIGDLVTTDDDPAEIRDIVSRFVDALVVVRDQRLSPIERLMVLEPAEMESSPLLVQLINITYSTVPVDDVGPVIVALGVLLLMIDSEHVTDAMAELERLLRETLGVAMYRLDAWITSLAAKRLAERRRDTPAGLQLGGFGWLLDLSPSPDPASQGFIHAPSMNHAATAAVLRSGWSAYGTAGPATPLSVDLSSSRVRGAQWALDAVRNGQDLSELLGARFERFLHDAHVDEWIETVRQLELDARAIERPPSRTVDGLLVARSGAGVDLTVQEQDFRDSLTAATVPVADPAENAARIAVRRAWRRLTSDLDAIADLTMAQAVHAIIQGNDSAASAAMSVMDGGDGAVPPIDVSATQRDAQLVHHRVVALFAADAPNAGRPSLLAAAEPRLARWAGGLLPTPSDVECAFTLVDAGGAVVDTGIVSLADVGLGSFEAATLTGSAPTQSRTRLGRAVRSFVASTTPDPDLEVVLDTSAALTDRVSVDEFGILGVALTTFLGRTRAMRAGDLARPAADLSSDPGPDVDELASRVAATEAALTEVVNSLAAHGPARVAALLGCATIGVRGAIAALESGAADDATDAVAEALVERLATDTEPTDTATGLLDRLSALIGGRLPILPVFTPLADRDRSAEARSAGRQREAATEAPAWLAQVAHVRPTLGALVDVELLGATVAAAPGGRYGLAQVPHTDGGWAAVTRPADDRDRLSILSLTGASELAVDGDAIAGLFVDGWTEGIPRRLLQTSIAVHFDAPTARPPQTILMSVVDDERGFSADELSDQLLHTIELAKMRCVGPDALPDIGHYLPAVFLPFGTTISGAT